MASLVMDNGFPVRGLIGASVVLVLSLVVVSGVSAMPPAYGVLGGLSVCVHPRHHKETCTHVYIHTDMQTCLSVVCLCGVMRADRYVCG